MYLNLPQNFPLDLPFIGETCPNQSLLWWLQNADFPTLLLPPDLSISFLLDGRATSNLSFYLSSIYLFIYLLAYNLSIYYILSVITYEFLFYSIGLICYYLYLFLCSNRPRFSQQKNLQTGFKRTFDIIPLLFWALPYGLSQDDSGSIQHPSQSRNQLFDQGILVPFSEAWYLESKIWMLGVLSTIGV